MKTVKKFNDFIGEEKSNKEKELTKKELKKLQDKTITDYYKEKDFDIEICRTGYAYKTISVTAKNKKEAIKKALKQAHNEDFPKEKRINFDLAE